MIIRGMRDAGKMTTCMIVRIMKADLKNEKTGNKEGNKKSNAIKKEVKIEIIKSGEKRKGRYGAESS